MLQATTVMKLRQSEVSIAQNTELKLQGVVYAVGSVRHVEIDILKSNYPVITEVRLKQILQFVRRGIVTKLV
jgi:hypothetical protein